jgi:hypothetical protein
VGPGGVENEECVIFKSDGDIRDINFLEKNISSGNFK